MDTKYKLHQKKLIREHIEMFDKKFLDNFTDPVAREYWYEYVANMNYLNRWCVHKVELPMSIKARIIDWIKKGDFKILLAPIVEALEKNKPEMIYER